jgi:hypothetical protein
LTVNRDPDAVLSADNVGKRLAAASKVLRKESACISNRTTLPVKLHLKHGALFTAFPSLAPAASPMGPDRRKAFSVSFPAPAE